MACGNVCQLNSGAIEKIVAASKEELEKASILMDLT